MCYTIVHMGKVFLDAEDVQYQRFYKISMWWVTHRLLLKKIGLGLFAAVDVMLFVFALWTFLDAYVLNYDQERLDVARMVVVGQGDLHAFTLVHTAVPLEADPPMVFAAGLNQYDFYSKIRNVNEDWYADFDYSYVFADQETQPAKGFILPQEEKPLMVFGREAESFPREAELRFGNFRWHRLDPQKIPDWSIWRDDRLTLKIINPLFYTDVALATKKISQISFTVVNESAFSYYDPVFYIVLEQGARQVGITKAILASLDAGESREVLVNWLGPELSVNRVAVYPEINLLDQKVYKPLMAVPTSDVRERSLPGR